MKGVSRCSVLLGAFSYLQYHRYYHLVYLFVTIDVFHEEFTSLGTLLVCLVHDGTQSWGNESGGVSIGESDDGDILWDAQALGLDGVEGSVGDDVIEGEDGIRAMLALQEFEGGVACHVKVYLVAYHEVAVNRNMVVAKCLQVAMLATAHHVEVVRTADEGDALASCLYQVLGSLLGCDITIAYHLRELVLQAATGEKDEWHTHLVQLDRKSVV